MGGTDTGVQRWVEQSRDGLVTVSLDARDVVRVQLEPEVTRSWTAQMLSERVFRLFTVAQMRARCEERQRMNERGMDMPPNEVFPGPAEIAAYRSRFIKF